MAEITVRKCTAADRAVVLGPLSKGVYEVAPGESWDYLPFVFDKWLDTEASNKTMLVATLPFTAPADAAAGTDESGQDQEAVDVASHRGKRTLGAPMPGTPAQGRTTLINGNGNTIESGSGSGSGSGSESDGNSSRPSGEIIVGLETVSLFDNGETVMFQALRTRKSHRGLGVGQALSRAAHSLVPSLAPKAVRLRTTTKFPAHQVSVHMHVKQGYKPVLFQVHAPR